MHQSPSNSRIARRPSADRPQEFIAQVSDQPGSEALLRLPDPAQVVEAHQLSGRGLVLPVATPNHGMSLLPPQPERNRDGSVKAWPQVGYLTRLKDLRSGEAPEIPTPCAP